MTNVVDYDANQHAVDAVTVLQADRAEVKRKIKVALKDGQNDVQVKNLPSCLDEGSIRVDGIVNAVIFDVIYNPPPKVESSKDSDPEIVKLKKRKNELNSQLAIFKRQAEVLKEYSKTLQGKDTNAEQLDSFLDIYAARQATIDAKVADLEDEIKAVDEEIIQAQKHVGRDLDNICLRGVRLTIIVHATGDGEAELSIIYVVNNARWTPQYDLRAAIAADTKSKSSVELHYRASITQRTGEDWNSVALTLSTASPLTGTDVPVLSPLWIGVRQKQLQHVSYAKAAKRRASPLKMSALLDGPVAAAPAGQSMGWNDADVTADFGSSASEPPEFFRAQDSEATEGALSTAFGIPGVSTIPSDTGDSSGDGEQSHKVSIAQLVFDAVELEWLTVPRDIPSAYLQCKVQNSSKYVLLQGPANVFMNNNFVSKSRIPHVSPQESFTTSLGVDPAVRVTYHPQSKRSKTSGGGVLSTKHILTSIEQGISIKNTRLTSLHRLIVKDQIPVSSDARIKVSLIEPRELANAGKISIGTSVPVSKGVHVRWVPRGEDTNNMSAKASSKVAATNEELDAESARGLLEWVCEIDASSSVDLRASWEVSAPVGLEWGRMR